MVIWKACSSAGHDALYKMSLSNLKEQCHGSVDSIAHESLRAFLCNSKQVNCILHLPPFLPLLHIQRKRPITHSHCAQIQERSATTRFNAAAKRQAGAGALCRDPYGLHAACPRMLKTQALVAEAVLPANPPGKPTRQEGIVAYIYMGTSGGGLKGGGGDHWDLPSRNFPGHS
eukprot:829021-Pelagomonas_calceolata.AAC.2